MPIKAFAIRAVKVYIQIIERLCRVKQTSSAAKLLFYFIVTVVVIGNSFEFAIGIGILAKLLRFYNLG